MALILAVEPDRKQAALVKALAGECLSAELVIEASAECALRALGSRVPDLVLASPLLSWHDETMLGDRLRELGGAASHVQTLTIPRLAAPARPTARKRGVLSALRGQRGGKATTDGCDLEVFAQQIREYLASAAHQLPEPVPDAAPQPVLEVASALEIELAPEAVPDVAPEPIEPVVLELVVSGVVEPVDDGFALTAPSEASELAAAVAEADLSAVALAGAEGFAPLGEALEAHPLLDFNALPDPVVEILPVPEPALAAAVEPDPVPWVDLSLDELVDVSQHLHSEEPPIPDDVWVLEPIVELPGPTSVGLGPTDVTPGPTTVSPGPTSANPGATSNNPGPTSVSRGATSVRKRKVSPPAQDEWGFFDPAQCGFAALIAKLDQITEDEVEIAGSVRVISNC